MCLLPLYLQRVQRYSIFTVSPNKYSIIMMNSREILEFITDNEKVTLSKLSQLMGIKRAQPLYDIRDGKIKAISANYADKILSVFPEYSRVWLITGEGQPFSKNENEENIGESIIMAASERFFRGYGVLKD
jgi:hypothetical protein